MTSTHALTGTTGPRSARRSKPATTIVIAAFIAACLLMSFLVVRSSRAAFQATTDNSGNSFASGTVVLTDDDSSSSMFSVTNMAPGDVVTKCIKVSYTGSISGPLTAVKLYGSTSGTLASSLELKVDVGDAGVAGAAFPSCPGAFSGSTVQASDLLSNFSAAHSNFGNGVSTWTPSSGDVDRVMRFTATLPSAVGNGAQNQTANANFTWEIQSA